MSKLLYLTKVGKKEERLKIQMDVDVLFVNGKEEMNECQGATRINTVPFW